MTWYRAIPCSCISFHTLCNKFNHSLSLHSCQHTSTVCFHVPLSLSFSLTHTHAHTCTNYIATTSSSIISPQHSIVYLSIYLSYTFNSPTLSNTISYLYTYTHHTRRSFPALHPTEQKKKKKKVLQPFAIYKIPQLITPCKHGQTSSGHAQSYFTIYIYLIFHYTSLPRDTTTVLITKKSLHVNTRRCFQIRKFQSI